MEDFSQNEASDQRDPISMGSIPRHPSNQNYFRKKQIDRLFFPPVAIRPSLNTSRPSAKDNKPVSISISQLTVLKVPFFKPRYGFLVLEWFNLAREEVLRLRVTTLLVRFLDGYLVVVGTRTGDSQCRLVRGWPSQTARSSHTDAATEAVL
jgi:hypothetical protein